MTEKSFSEAATLLNNFVLAHHIRNIMFAMSKQLFFFIITIFTNNTLALKSDWKTSTALQYLRFIFLNFS